MSEGSRAVRVGMGGRCMVTLRAMDGFWICFADAESRRGFASQTREKRREI